MEAIINRIWESLLAPLIVGLVVAYFEWWLYHNGKK